MTPPPPPTWPNLRTDPDAAADRAIDDLLWHVRLSPKVQCYLRDSLRETFTRGEEQGETRALRLLLLARVRWSDDPCVTVALMDVITLLAPDVAERIRENETE